MKGKGGGRRRLKKKGHKTKKSKSTSFPSKSLNYYNIEKEQKLNAFESILG